MYYPPQRYIAAKHKADIALLFSFRPLRTESGQCYSSTDLGRVKSQANIYVAFDENWPIILCVLNKALLASHFIEDLIELKLVKERKI